MLGLGSGNGREASVPYGRPKASRLLAGAAAVLLVSTAFACGTPGGGNRSAPGGGNASTSGAIRTPHVISIPTGNLDAFTRCMLDLGWQITAVYTPAASGEPAQYQFAHPDAIDPQELHERTQQCEALKPSPVPLSDQEIRDIYYRWVPEYQCLVGLGYQPDPPPSVEMFVASYRTLVSPWMPINGIATDQWNQAQYDEAKAKCGLDMFSDDRYER